MPLSFVKKAFSPSTVEEEEYKVVRGSCQVHITGDKIEIVCDDGTREVILPHMRGAGCVVYVSPDGKPHLECERDITKVLQRIRRA